jgi:periplasmic divalent cation tolerance protein
MNHHVSDVVIALTTVPVGDVGERIAQTLVDERLAACVVIQPRMTSIYRWDGHVQRDTEHQLVIKTTADRVDGVRQRLAALHPYDLPEFLVWTVSGESPYLEWVRAETAPPGS